MRHRLLVCVFATLVLVSSSRADEPTAGETRFIGVLVTALTDDSTDVRAAAEEGLRVFGARAAHVMLRRLGEYDAKTRDAAVRVLEHLGSAVLAEIQLLEKRPAGAVGEAIARLESKLTATGGQAALPDVDPKVKAAVDQIVASLPRDHWGSHDPATDRLAALGRGAVPALLAHLDPNEEERLGLGRGYVVDALCRLATKEDVHLLGRLLDDGWEAAAAVLQSIEDPRAVPYLVNALSRGLISKAIGEALLHYRDPRARKAAVAFLDGAGTSLAEGIDEILKMLVELEATEALPAIRRMVKGKPPQEAMMPGGGEWPGEATRRNVVFGRALVGLGDPSGIPLLIDALTAKGIDEWLGTEAGEALNRATGQYHWKGSGSGQTAHAAYVEWWSKNEGKIEWNPSRRRFVAR